MMLSPSSGDPVERLEVRPIESLKEFKARITREDALEGAAAVADAYQIKWHGDRDEAPLEKWLIDKLLPEAGVALVSGQWGTYKTFFVLGLAQAVMTKAPFAGRAVNRQGGVLFIAAEGQSEIRVRLEGAARAKAATLDGVCDAIPVERLPFAWLEFMPQLTADDARKKLKELVESVRILMEDRFGLSLAIVVIDTMMRAAGFRDDGGSSLTLAGALTNSGSLNIGNTYDPDLRSASDEVTAASLDDTGSIDLTTYFLSDQALLDVTAGAAGFGAAGVLSGNVDLSGDSAVEFASGQITSVAADGKLSLRGNDAFIEDSAALGSNSALTGLSNVAGTLYLSVGAFL